MNFSTPFQLALMEHHAIVSGRSRVPPFRSKAWDRFLQLGLPHFRYARLQDLYQERPEMTEGFWEVNNRVDFVEILPLEEAWVTYGAFLQGRLGQSVRGENDPFSALNAALHGGGLFVYVPPGLKLSTPLYLKHLINPCERVSMVMPRLHLFLGTGACAQIVLDGVYPGSTVINQVVDIALEGDAQLTFCRVMADAPQISLFDSTRVTLKGRAQFHSVQVTDRLRMSMSRDQVTLLEEGAEVELSGAAFLRGHSQMHKTVKMEHLAPHCRSLQLFKHVLDDFSRSSFCGMIDVAPEAQKTDAYQMNKNLLLSDRATANSKPELQIRADDVKASHGATIGRLDSEELFYLRSRGLKEQEAQRLLVGGFVSDVTGRLPVLDLRAKMELAIHGMFGREENDFHLSL